MAGQVVRSWEANDRGKGQTKKNVNEEKQERGEHRLGPKFERPKRGRFLQRRRFRSLVNSWQQDLEAAAASRFALYRDVALALLHDTVHRGEAEPSPAAQFFGSEERFEDMSLGGRIHAHAGVGNHQLHISPRARAYVLAGIIPVEFPILGFEHELTAVGHSIARVHHQIQEHLLNLIGISQHRAEISSKSCDHSYVFTDQALQHGADGTYRRVQIEDFWFQHLAAAESQQLAGQRGGPIGCPLNLVHLGSKFFVAFHFLGH